MPKSTQPPAPASASAPTSRNSSRGGKRPNTTNAIQQSSQATPSTSSTSSNIQCVLLNITNSSNVVQGRPSPAAAVSSSSKKSTKKTVKNLSVEFLIDASGSMFGKPIQEAVQLAYKIYREHLEEGDFLRISTFANTTTLRSDWKRKSSKGKYQDDTNATIQSIVTGGGTAMHDGIWTCLQARRALEDYKRRSSAYVLVVLTDGGDNCSSLSKEQVISEWKSARSDPVDGDLLFLVFLGCGSSIGSNEIAVFSAYASGIGSKFVKICTDQSASVVDSIRNLLQPVVKEISEIRQQTVTNIVYISSQNTTSNSAGGPLRASEKALEKLCPLSFSTSSLDPASLLAALHTNLQPSKASRAEKQKPLSIEQKSSKKPSPSEKRVSTANSPSFSSSSSSSNDFICIRVDGVPASSSLLELFNLVKPYGFIDGKLQGLERNARRSDRVRFKFVRSKSIEGEVMRLLREKLMLRQSILHFKIE